MQKIRHYGPFLKVLPFQGNGDGFSKMNKNILEPPAVHSLCRPERGKGRVFQRTMTQQIVDLRHNDSTAAQPVDMS